MRTFLFRSAPFFFSLMKPYVYLTNLFGCSRRVPLALSAAGPTSLVPGVARICPLAANSHEYLRLLPSFPFHHYNSWTGWTYVC